jgi:hypothetical protein
MVDSMNGPVLPVGLDDLIAVVNDLTPDHDEIARLRAATVVSDRLGELGDHLVGHFVNDARAHGASWRAIGDGLGVTRQAAQQRFMPPMDERTEEFLGRFTDRARHVLAVAQEDAQARGSAEVGTSQLLLGLVDDPGGLSAQTLTAMGVSPDVTRGAVAVTLGPAGEARSDHVPFATESKQVLASALREAIRLGHNYIGTEHLLLGLVLNRDSSGAKILTTLGITRERTAETLQPLLDDLAARSSKLEPPQRS